MKQFELMNEFELRQELKRKDEHLAEALHKLGDLRRAATEFSQARELLGESESHLRLFIEQAPVSLAMFDRSMRYLSASRRWLDVHRLSDLDLCGLSHYELIPEIGAEWREAHRRGLAGEVLRSEGDRLDRRDGSVQWMRWEICPWHDQSGAVGGIVIFAEDVTQRKLVEDALKASEQRYRDIAENHTDYVSRYLPGGILTFVNTALARLTGLKPEELLGTCFYPYLEEGDREAVISTIEALTAENPIAVQQVHTRLSDGMHLLQWTHCALTDEAGNIVEYQSTGRDITEQKRIEDGLRESELRYRAVVEDQTEIIARNRPDGVLTFASDTYCRFFGRSREELIGSNWKPVIFSEDLPMVRKGLSQQSPEHPVVNIECRIYDGAGELRWMQFLVRGFFDAAGKLQEMQGVGRDITDRKSMQDDLLKSRTELKLANELLELRVRQRTADLEAAIREQESFSYSVSHDLRAPLRHINSFSAILKEDHGKELSDQARAYLDRIGAASSRMGSLIDNLLELSRVNRVEIKRAPVDLSKLAASTLRMFQETEPGRCEEHFIEPDITTLGDYCLLRQLFENLMGNAWKYTSKKPLASIRFGRTVVSGQQAYFVSDNGAGFDMAYRKNLFGAFQRLHGAEFEGIGIGLATAQRIVQRHGGKIWAEGAVDQGATFYFTLPSKCEELIVPNLSFQKRL
jgi:PAS domain S-box-containing protein